MLKEHQAGIPTDVAAKADHFKQTLPGERPLSEYSWQHASGWDGGGGRTAAYRLVILRTGQSVVGPVAVVQRADLTLFLQAAAIGIALRSCAQDQADRQGTGGTEAAQPVCIVHKHLARMCHETEQESR